MGYSKQITKDSLASEGLIELVVIVVVVLSTLKMDEKSLFFIMIIEIAFACACTCFILPDVDVLKTACGTT